MTTRSGTENRRTTDSETGTRGEEEDVVFLSPGAAGEPQKGACKRKEPDVSVEIKKTAAQTSKKLRQAMQHTPPMTRRSRSSIGQEASDPTASGDIPPPPSGDWTTVMAGICLLYTSPSPRDS